MPREFVLIAHCKHGNNVGFVSSAVSASSLRDFIGLSQFTSFTRHSIASPSAYASFCSECDEERTVQAVQG